MGLLQGVPGTLQRHAALMIHGAKQAAAHGLLPRPAQADEPQHFAAPRGE